jgi:AAA15 family ATPase/GTPase
MTDHFITKIKIKNFKCFDDFKVDGLTRVNLIGGKNNVGKTAFMEACYINVCAVDVKSFTTALILISFSRDTLNVLAEKLKKDHLKKYLYSNNGIDLLSNNSKCFFSVDDKNGIVNYIFSLREKRIIINENDFSYEVVVINKIHFIDNFGYGNDDIKHLYAAIQRKDKEDYLNAILKKIDPTIQSFKIIEEKPQCKVNGQYLALTELGDGVRHIVSVVTALYASENGQLFIDEVDNGIHFTLLAKIWDIIFTLSAELNVQVFATTHSKECIEAFNRIQRKRKDKQSSYFEMARHAKTDAILMQGIDSKSLKYELAHDGKYRGE